MAKRNRLGNALGNVFVFVCLIGMVALPAFPFWGCSNTSDDNGVHDPDSGARFDGSQRLNASCLALQDSPELLASPHVAVGSKITYSSNPPSSGPHYPIWAAFQE